MEHVVMIMTGVKILKNPPMEEIPSGKRPLCLLIRDVRDNCFHPLGYLFRPAHTPGNGSYLKPRVHLGKICGAGEFKLSG
jgi:hypothetical protein